MVRGSRAAEGFDSEQVPLLRLDGRLPHLPPDTAGNMQFQEGMTCPMQFTVIELPPEPGQMVSGREGWLTL